MRMMQLFYPLMSLEKATLLFEEPTQEEVDVLVEN